VTSPASADHSARPDAKRSAVLAPFRQRAFTVIWTATVVSNVGSWMFAAAAAWLMTNLNSDPLTVSLVQVASFLPMFLFALPAGALTDIVDHRIFLLSGESFITAVSTVFAVLVWRGLITPTSLLVLTFLVQAGSAATYPAWQTVVPQLVPRRDLSAAIAMNSAGVNASRAIGPALGGVFTAAFGIAAPFVVNAVSNLGTIGSLVWWRPDKRHRSALPAEDFTSAIGTGVRYARYNPDLRASLARSAAFFIFASCYWALLPLVARNQVGGGAAMYGLLLGAIGAGALGGALVLPRLKALLGPDKLVAAGSAGTAVTLVLYAVARGPVTAFAASIIAGVAWIVVLATLNVSAQFALPEWVRGRGLAIYATVFFGSLTLGSSVWGQVASVAGVPMAHFAAAAGMLLAIPFTWRWKLLAGAGADLSPSAHWPEPIVGAHVDNDAGPVLVTVEYHVTDAQRGAFLDALARMSRERRRDGAYRWAVYEDAAEHGRFLETFVVASWLEHLRQHERVTHADMAVEAEVRRLVEGAPKTTHLVAVGTKS
jgi:predicted MFS family arabinose efflux permease